MSYRFFFRGKVGIDAVGYFGSYEDTNKQLAARNWPLLSKIEDGVFYQGRELFHGDHIVGDGRDIHPDLGTLIYSEEEWLQRFDYVDKLEVGEEVQYFYILWNNLDLSDKVEILMHKGILHMNNELTLIFTGINPYDDDPEFMWPLENSKQVEELFEYFRKDRYNGSIAWSIKVIGIEPSDYFKSVLELSGHDVGEWELDPYSQEAFDNKMVSLWKGAKPY